jgi:hypothetical protein
MTESMAPQSKECRSALFSLHRVQSVAFVKVGLKDIVTAYRASSVLRYAVFRLSNGQFSYGLTS